MVCGLGIGHPSVCQIWPWLAKGSWAERLAKRSKFCYNSGISAYFCPAAWRHNVLIKLQCDWNRSPHFCSCIACHLLFLSIFSAPCLLYPPAPSFFLACSPSFPCPCSPLSVLFPSPFFLSLSCDRKRRIETFQTLRPPSSRPSPRPSLLPFLSHSLASPSPPLHSAHFRLGL